MSQAQELHPVPDDARLRDQEETPAPDPKLTKPKLHVNEVEDTDLWGV